MYTQPVPLLPWHRERTKTQIPCVFMYLKCARRSEDLHVACPPWGVVSCVDLVARRRVFLYIRTSQHVRTYVCYAV